MPEKIICQCSECDCSEEFRPIDKELLLNLITHGRVDSKRAEYLTSRVGSNLCKNCFTGKHVIRKWTINYKRCDNFLITKEKKDHGVKQKNSL